MRNLENGLGIDPFAEKNQGVNPGTEWEKHIWSHFGILVGWKELKLKDGAGNIYGRDMVKLLKFLISDSDATDEMRLSDDYTELSPTEWYGEVVNDVIPSSATCHAIFDGKR